MSLLYAERNKCYLIDDIIESQDRNESEILNRAWKRIKDLEAVLGEMVIEYCDRDGSPEDMPLGPEFQNCEIVVKAMKVLGG